MKDKKTAATRQGGSKALQIDAFRDIHHQVMTTERTNIGKNETFDVVIIGAGAAGIGCGMVLRDLGIKRFTILEKHEIGASFRRWPAETKLLTPSFTINGFGMPDLNSIALRTSPAYTLHKEHPSGKEYAQYLQAITEHFQLPVREGINVEAIIPENGRQSSFILKTSEGDIRSRFVIWAAGEFQYPNKTPFAGAELCRHYATVSTWDDFEGEEAVVIGGYESGVDTAIHLANRGKEVYVLDPDRPWKTTEADPSLALSPFTFDRLRAANQEGLITFVPLAATKIEHTDDVYRVHLSNGKSYPTAHPPILATGFNGRIPQITDLFAWNDDGFPIVTEESDESTITPGLFLSGPMLRHRNVIFCFIYKFRQRFAIIGHKIAQELELDTAVLEKYRSGQMYLDDLSCCDVNCAC